MANSQVWKDLEREVAKTLNGKRRCRMGNYSESDSDVIHDIFEIECKKRNTIYPFNAESMSSLNEASLYNFRKGSKRIPIGVCQTPKKPLKLTYIKLKDLLLLIKYELIHNYKDITVGILLEDLGRIYNDNAGNKSKFISRLIQNKKFGGCKKNICRDNIKTW